MNTTDTVVKTAEGVAEVAARSRKLPQRLRTMLILVDGSMTAGQLTEAAARLGVQGDFLDHLVQQGLVSVRPAAQGLPARVAPPQAAGAKPAVAPVAPAVQPVPLDADRFRAAQKFMNDTAVDALGFRAFFFTLKLEKCFNRAELGALIDDYAKAIAKGSGENVARVLVARARELLS